jgi:hypothetical protein
MVCAISVRYTTDVISQTPCDVRNNSISREIPRVFQTKEVYCRIHNQQLDHILRRTNSVDIHKTSFSELYFNNEDMEAVVGTVYKYGLKQLAVKVRFPTP